MQQEISTVSTDYVEEKYSNMIDHVKWTWFAEANYFIRNYSYSHKITKGQINIKAELRDNTLQSIQ